MVKYLPVLKVDDFVEEKGSSCGTCESGRDQLGPVGQERVALGTREYAGTSKMF